MPERFESLASSLRHPALQSLAEEAVRDYVDWDQLAHRTLPPGQTLADTWEVLGIIRQFGATWFPIPALDRRLFWYSLTVEGHRCIRYIEHQCRSDSPLHRMMQGREGHHFLVRARALEAAAACRLDGIIADPSRINRMLFEGRSARTPGEQIALNSYEMLGELDELASEPFSPELVHSLFERLTRGVRLEEVTRGVQRTNLAGTRNADERRDEAEQRGVLQQICDYANGKIGDPREPAPLRAYMILHAMGYWQPLADLNDTVARQMYRLFAVKRDFPVLGYIPTSVMTERWFEGALEPDAVRFSRLERHPVVPGSIDGTEDILTHLQLATISIEALLRYIDVAQREDQELNAALDADESLNYRQRAALTYALAHPETEIRIRQHETAHRVVYRT
ncbi:MAG: hypothetical protein ACYC2X_07140, partial [Coriobacteriia bacterium]